MKGGLLILAIDLELSGCQLDKDNIVAIGWSAIHATTGDIATEGCIGITGIEGRRAFEPRCLDEFWSKNVSLLNQLQKEAVVPIEGIARFFTILDQLDSDYDVRIVSDNPCSDIAWLDFYASKFLDRKPLCYKKNTNEWRPVYDTDSFARAAAKIPYRFAYTSNEMVMKELLIDPKSQIGNFPCRVRRRFGVFEINVSYLSIGSDV
jgi:hypothetical protein